MNPGAPAIPDRIAAFLERSGIAPHVATVLPLTGDASDRRYFRVIRRQAPPLVLALHAGPFDADTLPFVRVAALFDAMPLPVPAILERAGDLGLLALEDLGDVTLQAHLGAASAAGAQPPLSAGCLVCRNAAASRTGPRVAGVPAVRRGV